MDNQKSLPPPLPLFETRKVSSVIRQPLLSIKGNALSGKNSHRVLEDKLGRFLTAYYFRCDLEPL